MRPLLVLLILRLIYSNDLFIPSEVDFLQILSNTETMISFTEVQKELYYCFHIKSEDYANGDIVFQFKEGKGYLHKLFIYTEISQIKNDDKGHYINYLNIFVLDKKEISIYNAYYTKIYLIFKAYDDYDYSDNIRIFNEKEIITLHSNDPYLIDKFYSTKEYTFAITSDYKFQLEVINLNLQTCDTIIIIKEEDKEVKRIENKNFDLTFNSGKYTVIISISNEYSPINPKKIMYTIINSELTQLEPEKKKEFTIISPKKLYLYAFLNEYTYLEENTITANFDKLIYDHSLINGVYAKVIKNNIHPSEINLDRILKPLFPIANIENECIFSLLEYSHTLYQLYFTNPFRETLTGEYLYLLLFVDINYADTIPYLSLSFVLSPRIVIKPFSSSSKYQIQIKEDIPVYLKFYNSEIDSTNSTIIFFSNSSRTVFYGNLTINTIQEPIAEEKAKAVIKPTLNSKNITRPLISFNSKEISHQNNITIRFCCKEQETFMIIQSIDSKVQYTDSPFNPSIYHHQDLKCNKPFYLIGGFNMSYTYHIYFETLFGKFELFNHHHFEEEVFNDEKIITNKFPFQSINREDNVNMQIISIRCITPGLINVYFFDDQNEVDMTLNKRAIAFVKKDTTTIIKYPKEASQSIVTITMRTPFSYPVLINNSIQIKENEEYESFYFQSHDDSLLSTISSDTYVIVDFVTENIFKEKESEGLYTSSNQYMFFKLQNSQDYYYFELTLSYFDQDFYYIFDYGNPTKIPLIDNNKWSYVHKSDESDWISLKYSNPYTKYNSLPLKEKKEYYFAINFVKPFQKNVYMNVHYEYLDELKSPFLIKFNELKKMAINVNSKVLFTDKSDNENESLFVFCAVCSKNQLEIRYNYDDNIISSHYAANTTNVFKIYNNLLNAHFDFNIISTDNALSSTIQLSYAYSNSLSMDFFNEINALNSQLKFENNVLYWLMANRGNNYFKEFQVYITNKTNGYAEYTMSVLCLIQKETMYSKLHNTSISFTEAGEYWVNVVGIIKGDLIAYKIFKPIQIVVIRKSFVWLYTVLGILVILSIANVAYFYYKKKKPIYILNETQPIMDESTNANQNINFN